MALRAAMTGHQVFSTLHANSALRAIPRLLDLGVKPEVLAGNLVGIVAQRLVRTLCPDCKVPGEADEIEAKLLGIGRDATLYRPLGCEACSYTGYRGRAALIEIVRWNAALDELLAGRASLGELTRAVRAQGFVDLSEAALRRVRDGTTTLEEAARVVDLTERVGG